MIGKIVTTWAGTSGGPGITQLYVNPIGQTLLTQAQAQSAANAVRAFWDSSKAYMPDEVILTVQPTVDMYDHGNGTLTNTVSAATPPTSVQGQSVTNFSMAAGGKVNLQTASINNGRRVRGTIYMVPMASVAFSATGTISAGVRTAMNTAGASLLAALGAAGLELIVWGRPLKNEAKVVVRQGTINPVISIDTAEKTAILRGRRD
jgi:hypothetical protein